MIIQIPIKDARELAVNLMKEADPENLAEFLTAYLADTDIHFFEYTGDDFIDAYTKNMDGKKFLEKLLENQEKNDD